MIVGVCGYGYTGSGAVIDLLKEYAECNVFDDFEFSLLYVPDGLKDLEYHLLLQPNRFMSSDIAIQRFKKYVKNRSKGLRNDINRSTKGMFKKVSSEYVEKITQLKWNGYWNYDYFNGSIWRRNFGFRLFQNRILFPLEKHFSQRYSFPPNRKMSFSVRPDDFYSETRKYINRLIASFSKYDETKKINVVNQLFPANCPETCYSLIEDAKGVVVNRDPRDLFIFCKQVVKSKAAWIPTENVSDFVLYYKKMRESIVSSKDTLVINFEDLIYNYDQTVECLENFMGIKEHILQRKYFNPDVSVRNTQLFLANTVNHEEISYIERELGDYLYDFKKILKQDFRNAIDI